MQPWQSSQERIHQGKLVIFTALSMCKSTTHWTWLKTPYHAFAHPSSSSFNDLFRKSWWKDFYQSVRKTLGTVHEWCNHCQTEYAGPSSFHSSFPTDNIMFNCEIEVENMKNQWNLVCMSLTEKLDIQLQNSLWPNSCTLLWSNVLRTDVTGYLLMIPPD